MSSAIDSFWLWWGWMAGWKTYAAYLRSRRWGSLRRQALKRDGYACRICNRTSELEVHHRSYPKVLGRESVRDLTTLCSSCHEVLTECSWVPGRRRIV